MMTIALTIARIPYKVLLGLIKYPQVLTEHTSGWLLVAIGWRIWTFVNAYGYSPMAYPGGRVFSVLMIGIGLFQITSIIVARGQIRGLATGAAFFIWLFLTCLFTPSHPSIIAVAYPVLSAACAISYLSIQREPHGR
jgi:hypothetical protein